MCWIMRVGKLNRKITEFDICKIKATIELSQTITADSMLFNQIMFMNQ